MSTTRGDDEPATPTRGGGLVRVRLDCAYDGTDFSGWARQPGRRTVCGVLEDALATVLRVPVDLTVAGRTDAGVHAAGQVAHADLPAAALDAVGLPGEPDRFLRRLGRVLPADVRLTRLGVAPPAFDARFGALRRHYAYRVATGPAGPDPLRARDTAWVSRPLDVAAVRAASAGLLGTHDFAAFCRAREGATTIRELQRLEWEERADVLTAHVSADAFCHSMVRSLVGALLAVGEGRREVGWPAGLLGAAQRASAVPVAPARGLSLARVDYPDDAALAARAEQTRAVRSPADTGGAAAG